MTMILPLRSILIQEYLKFMAILGHTETLCLKRGPTDGQNRPLRNGAAPPRHLQGVRAGITSPREQNRVPKMPCGQCLATVRRCVIITTEDTVRHQRPPQQMLLTGNPWKCPYSKPDIYPSVCGISPGHNRILSAC
jgi:hypothetical protein